MINSPVITIPFSQTTEISQKVSSVADAAHFENALNRPKEYGLGDSIIDKISHVKSDIDAEKVRLHDRLENKHDLSPSDLLQAQMELMRISLQQDLIAKSVGRTNQNVETLIKTQ